MSWHPRRTVPFSFLVTIVLWWACGLEPQTPVEPRGDIPREVFLDLGDSVSVTSNAWVDGGPRAACSAGPFDCNSYLARHEVWLNPGPAAARLGPDGEYFFAVLAPGGRPNPNDGGPGNLSDDFDRFTDRRFRVADGKFRFGGASHDVDSRNALDPARNECSTPEGCVPDGSGPFIRLFPFSDTRNPGGVYVLAVCTLDNGYPVSPEDCVLESFKVHDVPTSMSLLLGGRTFEDLYADGPSPGDPGLAGREVLVQGTGFFGEEIRRTVTTDENGFWDFQKDYLHGPDATAVPALLTACQVRGDGWTRSWPDPACHMVTLEPASLSDAVGMDFGSWLPAEITACSLRDLDGRQGGKTGPVEGWMVSLSERENRSPIVADTRLTGQSGCATWERLRPGVAYQLQEEVRGCWWSLGLTRWTFARARSRDRFSYAFVNTPAGGCTLDF